MSSKVEMLPKTSDSVNDRVAARVRGFRTERGLSLDGLAASSGVSRSALSLIERAESSATAIVLDKIAAGLSVPLASLFAAAPENEWDPVSRRAEQVVWRDPGSGYVRRAVSPPGQGSPISIVEVSFPPGVRVAFETGERDRLVHQQVWMLRGTLELRVGDDTHRLETGDCLALTLDQPTVFHNPTASSARYAVVVVSEPVGRR